MLNFGGTAKFLDYIGFGINFGMIPDIKISQYGEATLKYREYDAYGRLYLFGGAFFIGAGVGYHSAEGTFVQTASIPNYPQPFVVTSHGSVKAMILTPQVGWFSVWGSGFALGFDIGGQVPIAPSTLRYSTDVSPAIPGAVKPMVDPYIEQSSVQVIDTLDKIGKTPIPVFNLRIGFLL